MQLATRTYLDVQSDTPLLIWVVLSVTKPFHQTKFDLAEQVIMKRSNKADADIRSCVLNRPE